MAVPLTPAQLDGVRERIRTIAERQIELHGVAAVSLRSIAAEMGWTAASLYRYFKSKAELLDSVRAAANNRFADAIETAYASTNDLWQRSRAIGDAYVAFAFAERAAYQLMFSYEQDVEDKSLELRRAEQRAKLTLTTYVHDMVDAGLLDADPEILAHTWWATLHGFVVLRMSGQLADSPPFEVLRLSAMRLIARGARINTRQTD